MKRAACKKHKRPNKMNQDECQAERSAWSIIQQYAKIVMKSISIKTDGIKGPP